MIAIRLMPDRSCDGCRRQKEWGCHARPYTVINEEGKEEVRWHEPAHLPHDLLGEESWACPRQHLRENPHYWSTILRYYGMYRRGFLPGPGAVADQSGQAVDIFRILDDANDACDREEARRARERGNHSNSAAPRRGR